MAVIHLGHNFEYLGSINKEISINNSLSGICLTSDLSQYACLEPVRRLPTGRRVKLPDYLVNSLQALYIYDMAIDNWLVDYDFTHYNNTIEYKKVYNGIILGFPFNSLKDSLYKNGSYIYKLYMSKNDSRIYKNINVSISTQKISKHVSLMLSRLSTGPWTTSLSTYSILDTFYLKVEVVDIDLIDELIVPTEIISLSCLVCK